MPAKICFAFALTIISVALVVESIRTLISNGHELGNLHMAATLHSIFTSPLATYIVRQ